MLGAIREKIMSSYSCWSITLLNKISGPPHLPRLPLVFAGRGVNEPNIGYYDRLLLAPPQEPFRAGYKLYIRY